MKKYTLILWLCAWSALSSCRGKSVEAQIRDRIDEIASFAEARSADGILKALTEDYRDGEDRGKAETGEVLAEYFGRYRGIVIHVLATRFLELQATAATIQTDVSLSSGAAEIFRKAVPFSGEYYRFTCHLEKDGQEWFLQSAEWEYLSLEDLFPESMKILRKIFPDL